MPKDMPADDKRISQDAVVVVPGIMGSQLRDVATNDILWGLNTSLYRHLWTGRGAWEKLKVTDDERDGRTSRVVADALIGFGAFAPVLGGFEPYTAMVARLRGWLADPTALLEFAYDWRLPVRHNGRLLADAIDRHLTAWRANPKATAAARARPDQREPQVVIVAHSMGGLVSRAMCAIPGAADNVRAVLTLGTPFGGAAKTLLTLAEGRGAPFPLPRRRLRDVVRTLPGAYDLLPIYRCVRDGSDVRKLTVADVADVGADAELAQQAFDWHDEASTVSLPGHWLYIGGHQTTPSTITLNSGDPEFWPYSYEVNSDGSLVTDDAGQPRQVLLDGDGTVPLPSAQRINREAVTISQQHGSLARVEEALAQASAVVLGDDRPVAFLGDTRLGLDAPDLVQLNQEVQFGITGESAESATCAVFDESGTAVDHPNVVQAGGDFVARTTLAGPGVYRIQVQSGGGSPVVRYLLAEDYET